MRTRHAHAVPLALSRRTQVPLGVPPALSRRRPAAPRPTPASPPPPDGLTIPGAEARPARTAMLPLLLLAAAADSPEASPEKQRAPKPSAVALVFSAGYAGNHLPKDDAKFEK